MNYEMFIKKSLECASVVGKEMSCFLKNDKTMAAFEKKRKEIGDELWIDVSLLIIDSQRRRCSEIIVRLEELVSLIEENEPDTTKRNLLLAQQNEMKGCFLKIHDEYRFILDTIKRSE